MNTSISLIGQGQTRFGERWDKSLMDLIEEAVTAAIDSSRITALEIDAIIVSNMLGEVTSSQAHLGSLVSALLPHRPPAIRVESACGSGAYALHTACAFLESGRAKTVLVVGAEKMTDVSVDAIAAGLMVAADSEEDRPSGLTFPGIFGLIAARYMHEHGLTREELSLVSAVHHRNAKGNLFAQFRNVITPEAVSKSPLVADPLRLLDCSPISDGGAACILSTNHESEFRLAASSIASDAVSITKRPSITSFPASRDACGRALKEADITLDDLSCLETHDCFSIAALINLEDLGFANPGEGISLYKDLYEGKKTRFAINASGGLKGCGHPVAATGIKQLNDLAKQLTEREERWGMAHNFGGACASCGIHILERMHD
ncbi:thiolase domain-containing protein [Candidatus Peregrinibacteria bacterium]|nr:thiolase domain-containing protein [Candidatus Peregrinibacteria bacterium]MBI3816842.1 thiolase domain-containing protein [Candidatus Peregrinibacteria bacterium]